MNYTETHGVRLSKMMLGTAQLGLPYGMANSHGQPSAAESAVLLDTAREGGVNCFDTARHYGESEQVLGGYFSAHPGHGCTLVTKYRVDPALGTGPAEIEKQLMDSVEDSLQRLDLAQLPIYLAHNADDITQYGGAVVKTLERMKTKGLVKHLGLSVYHAGQIDTMLQNDLFEAVQLPMNVLDLRPLRGGQLERLAKAGCMVFVRSVFLQGMFFMQSLPEEFAWVQPHVQGLRDIAAKNGIGVAELAMTYIRDLPGVDCLVLGAETPAQVRDNIGLITAPALDDKTHAALTALSEDLPIEKLMSDIITWTNRRTAFSQGK